MEHVLEQANGSGCYYTGRGQMSPVPLPLLRDGRTIQLPLTIV